MEELQNYLGRWQHWVNLVLMENLKEYKLINLVIPGWNTTRKSQSCRLDCKTKPPHTPLRRQ